MIARKFNYFCLIGTEHSGADFSNLQNSNAISRFDSIIY